MYLIIVRLDIYNLPIMKITLTKISGVKIVDTIPFVDPRGFFARLFCNLELKEIVGEKKIEQINISLTSQIGAIRGLHFQHVPHEEIKLIRCLKGRVWDVVVDLRKNSPTFLKWHAEELSEQNMRMIVVPEGCAHGFQVLEENSELLYLHTEFYSPESYGRVSFNDPLFKISWPLNPTEMSVPDREQPFLPPNFLGF